MTQKERNEVREMITITLSGWQEATVQRENLIHQSLNKIDEHLEKLNGSVSEHEKIINQNIPHTIAQCPQAKIIDELKEWQAEQDGVETAEQSFMKRSQIADELKKTEKRDMYQFRFNIITAFLTITAILVTIYFSSKSTRIGKSVEQKAEITNQILAPEAIKRGLNLDSLGLNK